MNNSSVKLVYFSPTGTTQQVIAGIARGMDGHSVESIDITRPDARENPLKTTGEDLLIVGVPVYMGRVPALIIDWLQAIEAHQTRAVAVVVYGNRVYEDALLELQNILRTCGCRLIAGGAFIGEHSFSTDETPTAQGRPDSSDLTIAEEFGRHIQAKLTGISPGEESPEVTIPGCYPYRGDSRLWTVDFITVSDACTQCGICAENCPTGAIDLSESALIDTEKCITCCACLKHCPRHARTMKPGLVRDASIRLHTLYSERKEPELFL